MTRGKRLPAATPEAKLEALLAEIRDCRHCEAHLPCGPRPVLRASVTARVLIAGQAPGRKVHETGIPWNDASGETLREWLQLSRERFYDGRLIAIVPTGFCYPGTGRGGDLPPRPECAPLWQPRLRPLLPDVRLTLAIGSHALGWHLGERRRASVSDTVRAWRDYAPALFPLPHPSPRNRRWLRERPWFEAEVLPALRARLKSALDT
jgi:uracil-DNA glycosylase